MSYFRCSKSGGGPVQSTEAFPYVDGSNILHYADLSTIDTNSVAVAYRVIDLGSVGWQYQTAFATPFFQFTRPSDIKTNSTGFIIDGYDSISDFWNTSGNDKCIASGSNFINVSNFDYDGSTINDFIAYMQGKILYAPLINSIVKTL